ncbi:hypothetical protein BDZ89DRAFT_224575 [Hymenopellis radicata]|nr:hypothetical protein BDZ89DRAFT_224575 [Hymenopellis radicata]
MSLHSTPSCRLISTVNNPSHNQFLFTSSNDHDTSTMSFTTTSLTWGSTMVPFKRRLERPEVETNPVGYASPVLQSPQVLSSEPDEFAYYRFFRLPLPPCRELAPYDALYAVSCHMGLRPSKRRFAPEPDTRCRAAAAARSPTGQSQCSFSDSPLCIRCNDLPLLSSMPLFNKRIWLEYLQPRGH